jgi:hypothetical protein
VCSWLFVVAYHVNLSRSLVVDPQQQLTDNEFSHLHDVVVVRVVVAVACRHKPPAVPIRESLLLFCCERRLLATGVAFQSIMLLSRRHFSICSTKTMHRMCSLCLSPSASLGMLGSNRPLVSLDFIDVHWPTWLLWLRVSPFLLVNGLSFWTFSSTALNPNRCSTERYTTRADCLLLQTSLY